jgi:hypothetical protein
LNKAGGGSKKKKVVDEDDEDGKSIKRQKISYGREWRNPMEIAITTWIHRTSDRVHG